MRTLSQADMAEATRLTREGRLEEATALLQGLRRPGPPAARPAPPAPPSAPSAAARPTQPPIDMEPPRARGGAWTAPLPEEAASAGGAGPLSGLDALRGRLGRRGGPGTGPTAGPTTGPTTGPMAGLKAGPMAGLGPDLVRTLGARLGGAGPAAALPEGARFEERVHAEEAGSRPYKLYVPAATQAGSRPLVVMLHGCTQSPDDFAAGTRMNELAEEFGFLVAYPGQTQAANMSRCWNWFNPADQRRGQGEPAILAGLTRAIMEEFSVDPGQVYVAGLSAGGAKAAILGAAYPDLYAAIGVHSGLACGAAGDMASAFGAMRQGGGTAAHGGQAIPAIVLHGDRDQTVNPVNGDEVAAQAVAGATLRADVESGRSPGGVAFTRTAHRDASGRVMLEQWVLHGSGHAWSGGSPAGSYTDPQGPDASRTMVEFFLGHRLAAPPPGRA